MDTYCFENKGGKAQSIYFHVDAPPPREMRHSPPTWIKHQPVSWYPGSLVSEPAWPVPGPSPGCLSCPRRHRHQLLKQLRAHPPGTLPAPVRPQAEKQPPCRFVTAPAFVSQGAQVHPSTQRSIRSTPPFVTVSLGSNYIPASQK